METYNSKFPSQNEIVKIIFTENRNYREKATSLKSRMQKTELKKSSFFNEISLEYKATEGLDVQKSLEILTGLKLSNAFICVLAKKSVLSYFCSIKLMIHHNFHPRMKSL